MDIQELRRANLRRWTEAHGVPAKEKSYFSQLLGGASFGERAARRLEAAYGMGAGYLDAPPENLGQATNALSPAAQALADAVSDADRHGISQDVFIALMETLRLFRRDAVSTRPGRLDVEDPSH
ncbi:hypothetical protein KTD19_27990 [Burkholderia multivorans]|uniref:hypothetical protein n=1 Tax=Burkholderia multivorans TaxID=87883 RepID=UPI001C211AD1|nr:hypothetical protein [Burkholderia multivorans]MBU9236219.1 hypothetical protein [Burkholderia multivorans]